MRALAGLVMVSLLLSACGSDGPPPQEKPQLPTLSGIGTYDETVVATAVSVKGAAGTPRSASNSTGTNQYNVSLEALTAPYLLRWNGVDKNGRQTLLYSLATTSGNANVTPLTTLVVAQLLGQNPADAYSAFGASGGPRTELVTETNLAAAQVKVIDFLQDTLGVTVKTGNSSFTTATFKVAAGDPMFDSIKALDDKLAANGTTIDTLTTQIASVAALCIREKMQVTIDGHQRDFCPNAKTANRDDADGTIVNYVFTSLLNDSITVKVREDAVLGGEYVSAAGVSYTCSGTACGAITLGTPAADLTRPLTFSSADLAGGTSRALLNGTLVGAIPGVALPILACDNNKYYVIFSDRTVVGDCVDAFDPLGLGGTLNYFRGAMPTRAIYLFASSSSTNPTPATVEVVMDGNESLLSVFFYEVDPNTGDPIVRYVCQGSACNGVTLGAATVNTDILGADQPVVIRDIAFNDTVLTQLNADGTSNGDTTTLKASFRTVYYMDPYNPPVFPMLADCMPGSDAISITALSGPFNWCSSPANRGTAVLDNADVRFGGTEDATFSPLTITLHEGVVTNVEYRADTVSSAFQCKNDCSGVTVSAPDADGNRTVTFDGTVLHEEQSFPLPGSRTVTLRSGPIVYPPP
ncbi:MAG: hypothetical protein WDO56_27005 [Gammaproteobacteria bacterium]